MEQTEIVHIVDDDPDVLDAMAMLLDSNGLATKAYRSAREFLDNCPSRTNGCLVLDIRMPDISGLELQKQLHDKKLNLPTIFITGHGDVPMAVQAMKSGALDFLQKPFRDQELLDCIYRALECNKRRCQELASRHDIKTCIQNLTKREYEVMQRMVAGDITKVIADKLNVSPRTIDIHRARVMEKMKVKTLAQLVQKAMQINDQMMD